MTLRPLFLVLSLVTAAFAQSALVFTPPPDAAPKNKHVVLLSGDEEYRSEEALPMLAKILSQRHGFKCTVLFALDPDGTINPENQKSLPGSEALDSADAIVLSLRFRAWPDDAMQRFVNAYKRGVPIIALRTSTHAFNFPADSKWAQFTWNRNGAPWPGGFGKQVLGETWVSHWGKHKVEATRAVVEPSAKNDPLLRGVTDVFGTTDVYEAYPPADAKILFRGLVLKGMNPTDAPADYRKKRASDQQEQPVNAPAMAIAWTRTVRNDAGRENKILTTTMGAATDLENESLRRLVVNGVYWGLGLDVPAKADVRLVDPYTPRMYGFRGYRYKLKPADYALGKTVPEGEPMPAPATPKKAAKKTASAAEVGQGVPAEASRKQPATTASSSPAFSATAHRDGSPYPEAQSPAAALSFAPGEHVALIGNALADRMQHHAWLDTMIQAKFPQHQLVFRNLAVSGDEVATRARSKDFGTPDEWLARVQASTIFAFFGFNEAFAGDAGLSKFKQDLEQFLRESRAKNYSGLAAPRIVLFSPIAVEKHPDPNFAAQLPPDFNATLARYTQAMAEVAREQSGVTFVDLFTPSQELYAAAARAGQPPLTINGFHLSEAGEARLADQIFRQLFADAPPSLNTPAAQKLRAAVLEKNEMWHSRYRTMDGYNIYGGRSALAFPVATDAEGKPDKNGPKITNFTVMQEEMSQRDVMTANRDKRVWAVAKGGDLVVDDSNLPPVTKVPTNKPGDLPDGSHTFLSGEEAIAKMKVHAGLKVNLFADEVQFPELINPVQMAWDTRGRLWVAAWRNYPERTPDSKIGDSLIVLEDTDGDGRADKCTHFLDDLNCPTGFQFYKDGVLVVQAPNLWFVRDTDGDGKADWKERVLMGLDSADSHHTSNSLVYEPGGAIFLSDGVFHRTQVETARGPVRNIDAAIYRFEPRTGKFETYVAFGFANPHGRAFDYWGNDIIVDATMNRSYFGPAFSGQLDYPAKHPRLKEFWTRPSRPSPGSSIITSRHLPEEFWGNFLNANVISFQGIYRVKVEDDGSGLKGERMPDFISSTDPNFRPAVMNVGPDGAVYFADWSNAIIGHMQHHIRDPNRDHTHGRIYRVTAEGRPLVPQPKIYGQPIAALLDLLKAPENHVRELAKIELDRHDSATVIGELKKWIAKLDANDPAYQHHLTEALWLHQWHNVADTALLERQLRSPDANARAAATRVLCYWRDRVPNALALLKTLAADENPRVRLQAVRAASFFRSEEAVDVALTVIKQPLDYYLDYTLGETIKQLRPFWRNSLTADSALNAGDPARLPFLLRTVSTADLLKLPRTPGVLEQLLKRPGIPESVRGEALAAVAREKGRSAADVLLTLLDDGVEIDAPALGKLLVARPAAELQPLRARIAKQAMDDTVDARPHCWAALVVADGGFDQVWLEAEKTPDSLTNFLNGVPLLPDASLRAAIYPRLAPLVEHGPAHANISSDAISNVRRAAIRAAVSTKQEPAAQFRTLAQLIQRGEEVSAAAQALRVLPRQSWADADAAPIVSSIVAWAKKSPWSARTSRDYIATMQAAEELSTRLPAEEGAATLKQLRGLRVAVFLVRSVREEMRYDTTRLIAEAGKPIQIIFENPDAMPHNLVVLKAGTREKVGNAAMLQPPEQVDASGRAYVPDLSDVVAATKLLDPGQTETVRLPATLAEGVYEYVCTFPGHWMVMWGTLIVTKDPDAYAEKNPAKAAVTTTAAPAPAHAHTNH